MPECILRATAEVAGVSLKDPGVLPDQRSHHQPKGVQTPHIPLLIGGSGEQVTLKLVAQYGDACNVKGSIAEIKHKFEVLQGHCTNVGRDYASICRIVTTICAIAEIDEQALAQIPPAILARLSERVKLGWMG